MKTKFLSLTLGLLMAGTFSPVNGFAQDADKDKDKKPEAEEKGDNSAEEEDEDSPEAEKKAAEEDLAIIKSKLEVFKTLEGEWTGREQVSYTGELRKDGKDKVVKWKDEWKGFFTNAGRYFEMTGKTEGEVESTYHWKVTYDTDKEEYRAWSFGSNGFGEYTGQLTDDGKAVLWENHKEGDAIDIHDTFELRAKGDKCTATGETKFVSKDGQNSRTYANQNSIYTRKKIEI